LTVTAGVNASPIGVLLTAGTADVAGLTCGGLVAVATPTGSVATILLTASSITLTDLRIDVPCTAVAALGSG
jgi:hypothetical protein